MCKDVATLGGSTPIQDNFCKLYNRAITYTALSALLAPRVLMVGLFCYHLVVGAGGLGSALLGYCLRHLFC